MKQSSKNSGSDLDTLFTGRKSKWLPLYRRLLARSTGINGIEFHPSKSFIAIGHPHDSRPTMGLVRVTLRGLEISLGLVQTILPNPRLRATPEQARGTPRWITHRTLLMKASEIDDEFLAWVKIARHQARISRPRST